MPELSCFQLTDIKGYFCDHYYCGTVSNIIGDIWAWSEKTVVICNYAVAVISYNLLSTTSASTSELGPERNEKRVSYKKLSGMKDLTPNITCAVIEFWV